MESMHSGPYKFDMDEAPCFYPTEEEFENPLRFIASIRPLAEQYGLCKIVPPWHWKPEFALDLSSFKFKTKVQAIHQLQQRHAGCDPDTFRLEYRRFRESKGLPPVKWPSFDGGELDPCLLFNAVKRRGGFLRVTREKKWDEVLRMVKPERASFLGESGASTLRQFYETHLLFYEKHVSMQSKSTRGPKVLGKASDAAMASGNSETDPVKKEASVIRNLINPNPNSHKDSSTHEHPNSVNLIASSTTATTTAAAVVKNAHSVARNLVSELEFSFASGSNSAPEAIETLSLPTETAVERKKHTAKPSRTVDTKTDSNKNNKTHSNGEEKEAQGSDEICVQCKGGNHAEIMLLCDRCNRGWHTHCLVPPLSFIPAGNWYCPQCLNSSSEAFGFLSGQEYTLATFRSMADRFKRKWFKDTSPSLDEVEAAFWHVVENSTEPVNVHYGSDLDTSVYGSGFPRSGDTCPPHADSNLWDRYSRSPWNLNNFPKLENSVLNVVDENISGVIIPWLYIGMLFSSFCWHYEDHCFYSINYLHWGEPKCWYSVPGSSASAFEKVMKQSFPDLFESQPDLLFQLVTMLNPMVLKKNNVPICKTTQKAGEFVITFPRSYHGGFNHGLNCAEAVNFAPPDWLPWGGCGVEHYRLFKKRAVISHEELLCAVAKSGVHDAETVKWLKFELERVFMTEDKNRKELWKKGVKLSKKMNERVNPSRISKEEDPECMICHYYLHLSSITCSCRPNTAVCLQHSRQLCDCPMNKLCLHYRYSLAEIQDMLDSLPSSPLSFSSSSAPAPAPSPSLSQWTQHPLPVPLPSRKSLFQFLPSGLPSKNVIKNLIKKKVNDGTYVSHADVAASWIIGASEAMKSVPSISIINELLIQSEEFVWGGHDVDKVREMDKMLRKAKSWLDDVATCHNKIKSFSNLKEKVKFDLVKDLLESNRPPVKEEFSTHIQLVFEAAQILKSRIEKSLNEKTNINDLKSLYEEVCSFPLDFIQTEQLKTAIDYAENWAGNVQKLINEKRFLNSKQINNQIPSMDSLLHLKSMGENLKVHFNEHQLLDSLILNSQNFKDKLLKLLQSEPDLMEVEYILKEGNDFPVAFAELSLLQSRYDLAREWANKVHAFLHPSIQLRSHKKHATSDIRSLIDQGSSLLIKVPDFENLKNELRKRLWNDLAYNALNNSIFIEEVDELLAEAISLNIHSPIFHQLRSMAEKAKSMKNEFQSALQIKADYHIFLNINREISSMNIKISFKDELIKLIKDCEVWRAKANFVLILLASNNVDNNGKSLQTHISLQSLTNLSEESNRLQSRLKESEKIKFHLNLIHDWKDRTNQYLTKPIPPSFMIGSDLTYLETCILEINRLLNEGWSFKVNDLHELSTLSHSLKLVEWELKAQKLICNKPTLQEVESVIEEVNVNALSVNETTLRKLKDNVESVRSWMLLSSSITLSNSKLELTAEYLQEIIENGRVLPLNVSAELFKMENILFYYNNLESKIDEFLSGGSEMSWKYLFNLYSQSKECKIKSKKFTKLEISLKNISQFYQVCNLSLAKKNSNDANHHDHIDHSRNNKPFNYLNVKTDNDMNDKDENENENANDMNVNKGNNLFENDDDNVKHYKEDDGDRNYTDKDDDHKNVDVKNYVDENDFTINDKEEKNDNHTNDGAENQNDTNDNVRNDKENNDDKDSKFDLNVNSDKNTMIDDSNDFDFDFFSDIFTLESNVCSILSKVRTCLEKQLITLEKVKNGVFSKCACDKMHANKLSFLYCIKCRDSYHRLCVNQFIPFSNKKNRSSFLCPFCSLFSFQSIDSIENLYCKKLFSSKPGILTIQKLTAFEFNFPFKLKPIRLLSDILSLSSEWKNKFNQITSNLLKHNIEINRENVNISEFENKKINENEKGEEKDKEKEDVKDEKDDKIETEKEIMIHEKKLLSLFKIIFSSEVDFDVHDEIKTRFSAYLWKKDVNNLLFSQSPSPSISPCPPNATLFPSSLPSLNSKPSLSVVNHFYQKGEAIGIPSDDRHMNVLSSLKRKAYEWVDRATKAMDSKNFAIYETFSLLEEERNMEVEVDEKTRESLHQICQVYKCNGCCLYPSPHSPVLSCNHCSKYFHPQCSSSGSAIPAPPPHSPNQIIENDLPNSLRIHSLDHLTWTKKPRTGLKYRKFGLEGDRSTPSILHDVTRHPRDLRSEGVQEGVARLVGNDVLHVRGFLSYPDKDSNRALDNERDVGGKNAEISCDEEGKEAEIHEKSLLREKEKVAVVYFYSPPDFVCRECIRAKSKSKSKQNSSKRILSEEREGEKDREKEPNLKRVKRIQKDSEKDVDVDDHFQSQVAMDAAAMNSAQTQVCDQNETKIQIQIQRNNDSFGPYFSPHLIPRKRRSNLPTLPTLPLPYMSMSFKRKRSHRNVKKVSLFQLDSLSSPSILPTPRLTPFNKEKEEEQRENIEYERNPYHPHLDTHDHPKEVNTWKGKDQHQQQVQREEEEEEEVEVEKKRYRPSGRPCRQTAGHHSGYDAFFLLSKS